MYCHFTWTNNKTPHYTVFASALSIPPPEPQIFSSAPHSRTPSDYSRHCTNHESSRL